MSDSHSGLAHAPVPSHSPGGRKLALTIQRDLEVPMRDDTILRADLWLPAEGRRFPVLLQRTPYDKSFAPIAQGRLDPAGAVARGYGVMIQDVRGRFASDGIFEPFAHEQEDGVDTIAWITRQSFSNGRVAMYGASYPGAAQLLVAATGATGLRAIVPDITNVDFHSWMYYDGAFQLGFALNWARALAGEEIARRRRGGADVTELQERLEATFTDPWTEYRRLPIADQPLLDELVPAFGQWLAHPVRGGFWGGLSPSGQLESLAVPALHITGWHDVFVRGTLAQFTRLRQLGGTKQSLLVGPWGHSGWGDAVGDVIYGPGASRYELDLTHLHLDFYDFALLGAEGESSAPVRLFTMGVNRWRDEDSWPPVGVKPMRLHLRSDARLTHEPPATDEAPRSFLYDPHYPVPTSGGATFMPGHEASIALGSRDQRALHARADVLVYSGEPLTTPLEVSGNVRLTLQAATSAPDTDWTAKLLDIHPDGRAMSIADGIVRARYSHDGPGPLERGRPHRFSIDAGPTSIVFGAGHRVAVEISSSNFPRFARNPNSGIDPVHAKDTDLLVATQRIHHDAARPSFLELPVRER